MGKAYHEGLSLTCWPRCAAEVQSAGASYKPLHFQYPNRAFANTVGGDGGDVGAELLANRRHVLSIGKLPKCLFSAGKLRAT
jgi:hypothetical protein